MSNMSYCRFQNTAKDFGDCLANLRSLNPEDQGFNTDEERRGRLDLALMASRFLVELGVEDFGDEMEIEKIMEELDQGEGYEGDEEDY